MSTIEGAAPSAEPLTVEIAEIPTPPDDVMAEMVADEEAAAANPAAKPAPERSFEVAALSFAAGKVRRIEIPLEFPFEHQGATVDTITMRRLTTYEVSVLARDLPDYFDNFFIYAAMAGLPAEIIRGLDEVDGDRVSQVGMDFLPRAFRRDAP